MTTEQIIKGLEESVKKIEAHYDARNIPKDKRPNENKKALALIKWQKAEIKRLNIVVEAMKGEIDGLNKDLNRWKDWYASLIEAQKRTVQGKQELIAQIENLKRENKYLRERLAEEMEHKEDMKCGEWVLKDLNNKLYESKKAPHCSVCNYMSFIRHDYCPNCGAKMKGE